MSVETIIEDHELEDDSQLSVDSVINWQLPVLVVLFVSIVFVSIKTVVNRHESRAAFVKLQKLEKERDRLVAQWSRLKLEQATTLNQVRVEQYARWDLGMKMPKASEVKIIQEPGQMSEVIAKKDQSLGRSVKVSTSALTDHQQVELGN